ncbi:MAG TPA: hypothetical protein VHV74_26890 [Pseudonocardiaceae bacterium]|jgi:23S rRNA (adenine2030-N6)-methyltransferase|nr:hypothetical protein [Pseudonocardiaceae bacterium]
MSNAQHAGKVSEIWKHGILLEVLRREPPERYAETHAGSAVYPLPRDGERAFGVRRFLRLTSPVLTGSAYRAGIAPYEADDRIPGAVPLVTALLGPGVEYLLCDLDPESAADLRAHTSDLPHCDVVERDGMATVAEWLDDRPTVVHIDPFDAEPTLDFAAEVATRGHRLVYWYGYDRPGQRAWAHKALAGRTDVPLWCGDVAVVDADGRGYAGDLGEGTTPGVGIGVVLANAAQDTLDACVAYGRALAAGYEGAVLPDGRQGGLAFTVS